MSPQFLLDTGPLVAMLNQADAHYSWAAEQWSRLRPPLLTCEAVVSEACFLLYGRKNGPSTVLETLRRGALRIEFRLIDHAIRVEQLMRKYAQLPMSFADACLVCMAELYPESTVFTTDSHFRIYRKHGRSVIPTLMPQRRT
jgi:uncharacterized protein